MNNDKKKKKHVVVLKEFRQKLLDLCEKYQNRKDKLDKWRDETEKYYEQFIKPLPIPTEIIDNSMTELFTAYDKVSIIDDGCKTLKGDIDSILERLESSVKKCCKSSNSRYTTIQSTTF